MPIDGGSNGPFAVRSSSLCSVITIGVFCRRRQKVSLHNAAEIGSIAPAGSSRRCDRASERSDLGSVFRIRADRHCDALAQGGWRSIYTPVSDMEHEAEKLELTI